MTHPTLPSPRATDVDHVVFNDRAFKAIRATASFVALLTASIATGGSLFLSEVLGWVPCTLCWYQRILMYPLGVILLIGIMRGDRKLHQYVLPFSLVGAGVSTYHYLLQKTDWFPPPACTTGVPCTVDYINLFGFVTVPFLALVAFLIISASSLASMLVEDEFDAPERRSMLQGVGADRAAAVAIVVLVVVGYWLAASLLSIFLYSQN